MLYYFLKSYSDWTRVIRNDIINTDDFRRCI